MMKPGTPYLCSPGHGVGPFSFRCVQCRFEGPADESKTKALAMFWRDHPEWKDGVCSYEHRTVERLTEYEPPAGFTVQRRGARVSITKDGVDVAVSFEGIRAVRGVKGDSELHDLERVCRWLRRTLFCLCGGHGGKWFNGGTTGGGAQWRRCISRCGGLPEPTPTNGGQDVAIAVVKGKTVVTIYGRDE